jgi:hypothetical protein
MIAHRTNQHGPAAAVAIGWLAAIALTVFALSDGPARLARHNLDAAAVSETNQ